MTLKDILRIVPVVLMATLAFAGFCYADEDDEPLTKQYGLGEAPPPKQKVIKTVVTKTKIVNQCPTGFFWNEDARKCLDEDGNEAVPKRKQAAAPRMEAPAPPRQPAQTVKNDRYIYPGTKLRVKVDKCTMLGETVKCTLFVTNTAEGHTYTPFTDATLTDDFNGKYKVQSQQNLNGTNCYGPSLCYGDTATVQLTFPLVNPATNTVSISSLLEANKGSDFVKFEGIDLLK